MARSGNRHGSSFCRQYPFQAELRTLHRVRVGTWGGAPEGGIEEAARSLETLPYPVQKKSCACYQTQDVQKSQRICAVDRYQITSSSLGADPRHTMISFPPESAGPSASHKKYIEKGDTKNKTTQRSTAGQITTKRERVSRTPYP